LTRVALRGCASWAARYGAPELPLTVGRAGASGFALALLAEHDEIALLLVDWAMPGMDVSEVAPRARLLRPDLAVLISTGYGEHGPRSDQPADVLVLKKPYRMSELATAIEHALARRA
jgi:CheY-like chemotaxis protein